MEETRIVKAGGAGEFLALVPAMLGFNPTSSLVMVAFEGNRSKGVARIDRNAPVAILPQMLSKLPGVTGAALIVYTNDPVNPPDREHVALAAMTLSMEGIEAKGAFVIGSDGWWSAAEPDEIQPLSELTQEQMPTDDIARDQTAGTEPIESPLTRRLDVVKEMATLMAERTVDHSPEHFGRLMDRALDGEPTPRDLAELLLLLNTTDGHSLGLLYAAKSSEEYQRVAPLLADPHHGKTEAEAREYNFIHGGGPAPDHNRVEAVIMLCRELAGMDGGKSGFAIGPELIAGWCNWALGRGSKAVVHLERSIRYAEDHLPHDIAREASSLARDILHGVNLGLLPDWVVK